MLIAKLDPGSLNAPYVTDMNTIPVPSMTYSVNGTFSKILDIETAGLSAPGTRNYTVILFMPVVSQSNKVPGNPSAGKSSGFHVFQVDDPNTQFINPLYVTEFAYRL